MKHTIIDGIGPFFRRHPEGRINWSKIPFAALQRAGGLCPDIRRELPEDFDRFCRRAAAWGFNTITLDDLAHLYLSPHYPAPLRSLLMDYAGLYHELVAIARRHGLAVWFTTDIMFYPRDEAQKLERPPLKRAIAELEKALHYVFERYPDIGGIIFRIGESDAHDVTGDFLSRLVIRSPRQGRHLVERLLPVFERYQRLLIFRTWSVGAFSVGDLLWNRDTYDRLFRDIRSPNLLVSIKYGESDFFRYLPLNPRFSRSGQRKIIELQARREYEGFGEFPSFIGSDYQAYRDAIKELPEVVGMSVWGQTGGWSHYRRLTLLQPEAVWNDINVWTCIRLFRDGVTVEGAVRSYFQQHAMTGRWDRLLEMLECSERVIKTLLYTDDFANRRIYFRRLRVPPLLAVYWDHIFINGALRKIHRCFVFDGEAKIRQAREAIHDLRRMGELAREVGLSGSDIVFMTDTLTLLALARVYYFRDVESAALQELEAAVTRYRETHGKRAYQVHVDTRPWRISRRRLKRLFAILLRERRGYRRFDRLFVLRGLALVYSVVRVFHRRLVPEFARQQAMGIDTIFK
ncbi:MAG TPA: hypothetical protein PKE26_09265 [Kiritimatiellia bacterium]|nr:hypothetical protein [Kiritimatiellia bacterium]HMP95615.1 hypothetical protein [Kiritimatiellia bacterium]